MKETETWLLDDQSSNGEITPQMLSSFKTTSGWLRYLGIAGVVLSSLGALTTFVTLFGLFSVRGVGYRYSGVYFGSLFFSLLFMVVIFYLSVLLLQYGNRLKSFINTGKSYLLEEALEKQKIYWMVAGILTTVSLVLYFIVIILGILNSNA